MLLFPHGRGPGSLLLHTKTPRKTQAHYAGLTDFFLPITSAPSKTPDFPIFDLPDNQPPLSAYDLKAREPERRVRLWRCAGKTVYGHRIKPAAEPEIYERVLHAFAEASQVPARARRKGRVEASSAISNQAAQLSQSREWRSSKLWRRQRLRFRDFGRPPPREPERLPKFDTTQLAAEYLGAGGSIGYYPIYDENGDAMRQSIELSRDCGAWHVALKKDGRATDLAYFRDFEPAQKFALRAALQWRREHWICEQPAKAGETIAL